MFFSMLESLKIVLPSRRELDFYIIALFESDAKSFQKIIKKSVDFELENREKSMQKRDKIASIFFIFYRFFDDLGFILEGLGELLVIILPSKTGSKSAKLKFLIKLQFLMDLGKVCGGFWEGFGRVLGRVWDVLGGF